MNSQQKPDTLTWMATLAAIFLIIFAADAPAATITVNSLDDVVSSNDGQCTLTEAISSANNNSAPGNPGECIAGEPAPVVDEIIFEAGLTGTITLSSTLPDISEAVHLIGPGMDIITIEAGGASDTLITVVAEATIEGLGFTGGIADDSGGAILSFQPLIVRHCRFEDNRAGTGGAIRTYHDLTVESSDFRNNIADTFFGGAIRFSASNRELIVRDSLFENNTVLDGARHGGAIMVDGTGHVTLISGSTFVDNAALDDNGDGGAISLQGDTASIINSTFIGNQSGRYGGAIEFGVLQATMANVTIVGNLGGASGPQPGAGGGIYKAVDSITVTVLNSIVAGNGVNIGDDPDCSGVFVSGGHNLIGQASSGCSGFVDGTNGDQAGTALAPIDPLLASLEDNGGPTPTLALLPGSPAIDAGNPAGCTDELDDPLTIDQRGQPRPVDGDGDGTPVCDIGAFERKAPSIIIVNSLNDNQADDGACTLREAIIAANTGSSSGATPGECAGGEFDPVIDRIVFQAGVTGTIMLSSGLPNINDPVDILGPGSADLIIDGSGITASALRVGAETLIEGLSIANTVTTSDGGAIDADQPLLLRDVVLENNQAIAGGAIRADSDLTLEGCVVGNNIATDFSGGGILLAGSGNTLIIRGSLFENNQTTIDAEDGGALNVEGSDHVTEISGSTFTGNLVAGAGRRGGAARIGGSSLTITNSTFSGNSAGSSGGAIYAAAQSSTLINVTVSGNTADASDDGNGDGGGVYSLFATTIRNSLLANNTDSGGETPDCGGNITSDGFNLVGIGAGCSGVTDGVNGDQVGTAAAPIDPLLASLEDNGGPTPTLALLPGSPAIDAGNPAGCTDALDDPLGIDQRGQPRPVDGDSDGSAVCDIGAFEAAADLVFADRFED